MRRAAALAASLVVAACAQPPAAPTCAPPLSPALEVDLYFGRDKPSGGEVSDAEWSGFLAEVVTPRFPAGLSVLDVQGQSRDGATGTIARERSKLLVVVVFDAPRHRDRIAEIVDAYRRRFDQQGVLRVERPVCAGL
ncbi:MAG: DUF3574 domain-containing protein [Pseudomonadota bacterium]